MQERGQAVEVSMRMDSQLLPDSLSRNLLIDLVGSEKPDEFVLVSGHSDSWDTTEGANDDGGGMLAAWEAVRVVKRLGLKPVRTVRAVLWVNEENGNAGGVQYAQEGAEDNSLLSHSIAIESDFGVFSPLGLGVSCSNQSHGGCGLAMAQLATLSPLLAAVGGGGAVSEATPGTTGDDTKALCQSGVVCASWRAADPRLAPATDTEAGTGTGTSTTNNPCTINNQDAWAAPVLTPDNWRGSGYFWYHHSEADTMERIDPTQLNQNAAALAIWTYSIAQLPELLPRNAPPPSSSSSSSSSWAGPVFGLICAAFLGSGALVLWCWGGKQQQQQQVPSSSSLSSSSSSPARGHRDGRGPGGGLLQQSE
jgi:carboxypeptidase Q